jgi:diadenylate cyclase
VIIEKNRIITAASYLPISTNVDQSTMGARHRSALGLSESSDAVVIVTSEETGGISLFFNGDQIKVSSIQELREKLQALIKTKSTGNKK